MLENQKFVVQNWWADHSCFLKFKERFFYCCLFGWLNSILLAEQHKAQLLVLNYVIFFARNVSVFHLASQQKAEFLEKFVKINDILLSSQCKQDIQVHFLCLSPQFKIHYFIPKKKKNCGDLSLRRLVMVWTMMQHQRAVEWEVGFFDLRAVSLVLHYATPSCQSPG